jgi:hypothetical protein
VILGFGLASQATLPATRPFYFRQAIAYDRPDRPTKSIWNLPYCSADEDAAIGERGEVDDGARGDVARRRHGATERPLGAQPEPSGGNVSVGKRARNQATRFQIGRPPRTTARAPFSGVRGLLLPKPVSAVITAYLQRIHNY